MKRFLCSLLACAAASISVSSGADGSEHEYNLELVRSSVRDVLAEFSRQTGLQTGFYPSSVAEEGIFVGPLKGHYTAEDALKELFASNGLSFTRDNERTITVVALNAATPSRRGDRAVSESGKSDQSKPEFVRLTDRRFADELMADQIDEARRSGDGGAAESASRPTASANARGADSNKRQRSIEEIIVTAQRREERLQDVPISITVLGGGDLDRSTVQGINEALSRVPGVSINEFFLGGGAQLPVRGVAASQAIAAGSSPTAYYLDSVPFGFVKQAMGPDPDVFDLERVEVLRGPQGTLYGASALNGVVRVLTRDANLDELEFKARASTSSTEDGDLNYRGDMAVNVPIVDGKLAARGVIGYQDLSGWIDKPNNDNANDAQRRNMRLKINAQPTDELSIGASAWLSRADYGAPSAGDDNGQNSSLLDEPISTDYDAYGLKIGYKLPWFSVTSMTSYLDYANKSFLDIHFLSLGIQTKIEAQTFAQEVTLNSTLGGHWRWSLGGIYRDSEDLLFQYIDGLYKAPTKVRNISNSRAVFGELTRILFDGQFELTGGLRYFEDDVEQREDSRLTGVPPEQLVNSDSTFDATTPRLVLTWHPRDQTTVYASYSEGFRSGSDQIPTVLAVAPLPPAKPDTLTNYEVGAKGTLLGGRLSFDTALYYIDWQDVQQVISVRVPVGGTFRDLTAIVNGASASGMGFDFGVTTQPIDGLELGVNFSWNDLTMDSDVFSAGTLLFAKGDRVSFSPEYTVGASVNYVFPLGRNGFKGRFSASANYTPQEEVREVADETLVVTPGDSMLIARTNFGIEAPDHWTATLYVDNVNNERGSPARYGQLPDWDIRVRPRTIGLQFDYRY